MENTWQKKSNLLSTLSIFWKVISEQCRRGWSYCVVPPRGKVGVIHCAGTPAKQKWGGSQPCVWYICNCLKEYYSSSVAFQYGGLLILCNKISRQIAGQAKDEWSMKAELLFLSLSAGEELDGRSPVCVQKPAEVLSLPPGTNFLGLLIRKEVEGVSTVYLIQFYSTS